MENIALATPAGGTDLDGEPQSRLDLKPIVIPKMQSLQALRAVAALLVVMYHAQGICGSARVGSAPFHGIFGEGNKGVDLFFVLSGFIITYIHAGDWGRPGRIANFFFNRFSRIYPSVWIMTIFAAAVYAAGFGGAEKASKLSLWGLTAGALLLPQNGDAIVNVTWTLKYEIFFYALFAFLIFKRRVGWALLGVWQTAVFVTALLGFAYQSSWAGFYLRPMCLEFGIGILAAMIVMRTAAANVPIRLPLVILGIGTAAFLTTALRETYVLPRLSELQDTLIYGTSAGLIIYSLVMLESVGRLRVAPWLAYLGDASYAIYLVHFSVISLAVAAIRVLHLPLSDAVCLLVAAYAIVIGIGFDRFVDRPMQRLLRKLKTRALGSPSAASAFASPERRSIAGAQSKISTD